MAQNSLMPCANLWILKHAAICQAILGLRPRARSRAWITDTALLAMHDYILPLFIFRITVVFAWTVSIIPHIILIIIIVMINVTAIAVIVQVVACSPVIRNALHKGSCGCRCLSTCMQTRGGGRAFVPWSVITPGTKRMPRFQTFANVSAKAITLFRAFTVLQSTWIQQWRRHWQWHTHILVQFFVVYSTLSLCCWCKRL